MLVSDFDFYLPEHLIAQEAPPRGRSRLLVLARATGAIHHATVTDLPQFLRSGDLLVVNNTRVFPARLLGHRVPSGGSVECLLLGSVEPPGPNEPGEPPEPKEPPEPPEPGDPPEPGEPPEPKKPPEPTEIWTALMHPGQKLKPGARVKFEGEPGVLMAEVLERHFQGRRTIRLWSESGGSVSELVEALGHVPLPPYIKRPDTAADRERYQTVYAFVRGSVAAPTAGLHFTAELLEQLINQGVERAEITLHVGYGTFKPVKVDRVEDHIVDPELYTIGADAAEQINRAHQEGRRVIAVGTTTTRALEHAAICADGRISASTSLADVFIYPGFEFQFVDGLMTNFHLPKSSLLMLVSAFAGRERVLTAYAEAVAKHYRFYSYGDGMLIT
jgi:S-adenosylmethionine:tRNA ribosyltransferase-isomerase